MPKAPHELNLGSEAIDGVTSDDLPEQFGSRPDPPQPGPYRFRMPEEMGAIYETIERTVRDKVVTRIEAQFDEQHPLTIVQSPKGTHNDEPFETRINNAERKRDKAGTMASDADYLLARSFNVKLPKRGDVDKSGVPIIRNNQWYIDQIKKLSGKEFAADIEFTWYCNKKKNVRVDDGDGNIQEVEGRLGCGVSYYQNDVPTEEGVTPVRITCANPECGANLRAWPQLTRFRP